MDKLLSTIRSPQDLRGLSPGQLEQLAEEMREAICRLAAKRTAHFASNLGVVELTLALHTSFDFSRDRLIWDTGHQVYAHKLITGRYDAVRHHPGQGRLDGLSQSGGKRLRPVHDRTCRLQRGHGAGNEVRRRAGRARRARAASWPSSATAPSAPASSWRR